MAHSFPQIGRPAPPPPGPAASRLAPSPTGALHLGNARTFLVNWALARSRGWKLILRIEDLDGPRIKPGAIEQTINTLRWLGMDWDDGPIIQSHDLSPYRQAMERLARAGLVYPCELSRSEIEAVASAPQEGSHENVFPAALRPPGIGPRSFDDEQTSWRFVVDQTRVGFIDEFAGAQEFDPAATIGDFVVWTKRGQPSYQLAVVVDDHRQGVTNVVRGNDLVESAARQLLLYRALGLRLEPAYLHLPLVRGQDGKRLAKRHGDTRIETYRAAGVRADRVIALLGRWSGIEAGESLSAAEFAARLDASRSPRTDVIFTAEDDRWLRASP